MTPLRAGCIASLVGLALGFVAHQLLITPPVPEVREVERVVYKDRIVEKRVESEAKRVIVYRDRVTRPDGTKVEREVERTDSVKAETTDRAEDRAAETEHTRIVTPPRPTDWRVGALVGITPRLDPLGATPVFGAHVERRILGPVFVGAWGVNSGSVGLSLTLEF